MKLIGALTSKPYAFKARPWELENISSVDYHDAAGSNILVSVRGSQILRVLPKINNDINEEWISDKIRFSYDGLTKQRIFSPMLNYKGRFRKISWQEAFEIIKDKYMKSYSFEGICGNLCDAESMLTFKELLNKIGHGYIESRNSNTMTSSDVRQNYLMNTKFNEIDKLDTCILVGINPRLVSPILNLKFRKNVLKRNMKVYVIGYEYNLMYETKQLGNKLKTLIDIAEGKHFLCQNLTNSLNSAIYIGHDVVQQINISAITTLLKQFTNTTINIIHNHSSSVIGLELNCINTKSMEDYIVKNKVIYIYNCDEITINLLENNFIIYHGHTGDKLAQQADLVLPGSTLLEKNGTLINNEGKKQLVNFCV